MKKIIEVDLRCRRLGADVCELATDMLVLGRFSDAGGPDRLTRELDKRVGGAIGRVISLGDFKGKQGSSVLVYGDQRIRARRVLLVGLGQRRKATLDTARKAAATAARQAVELRAKRVSLAIHGAFGGRFDPVDLGRALGEGVHFGSYRYDEFVTKAENGRHGRLRAEVVESDAAKLKELGRGLARGSVIGSAQSYARTLSNRPGNVINPPALAAEARKLARGLKNVTCTIFDQKQLKARGMGGVLAVGSGSKSEPRFIVLKYTGRDAGCAADAALVGKAITFDSGGISIKPAPEMDQMKLDKSGGIAVLGTIKAVAELGLPLNVYGIVPSAENMPGGHSYRPGDIVKTYSGKTVEILNTDAEGRMILCDGLAYAAEQKCSVIIDIATLTGACMVALGKYKAGLMSNDQGLVKQLQRASRDSGEDLWHMPSGDEYAEEMKSKIADLKNIGSKWGGACTAAAFLRQFVGDAKWAHLDIAGMDIFTKAREYTAEGSTGFGVRLLTSYLMNLAEQG